MKHRNIVLKYLIAAACVAVGVWLLFTTTAFFRIDLTEEKRYSLSDATTEMLRDVSERMSATIYLTGDLDANMLRLSHAAEDMVHEINSYIKHPIDIARIDPNDVQSDAERFALYEQLESRGLRGMNVSVRSRGGRMSEQVIFPWAEISDGHDTVAVCLMQPSGALRGEEAVNAAVEDLEFQFADAIRLLTMTQAKRIAFIEGHDELSEEQVYDASEALSRYFHVDRGTITPDISALDAYAAIIVAGPKRAFSEVEKFVLDQYIMRGGRILWLVDGTQLSSDMLSDGGASPILANDVNLSDMLFRYGVRITPSVLEDMQCAYIPVNISRPGDEPRFEPIPWFYMPLLQTSPYHPVTKSMPSVKADFASGIEIVGDTIGIRKDLLLATSNATHVSFAPNMINVGAALDIEPAEYFTAAYVPVAVALEGTFTSIYNHRMPPLGMEGTPVHTTSRPTRMVVVADADIIRNDVESRPEGLIIIPLGYDRVTRRTHANRDFILNTMLYLTDDEGIMSLRNKRITLRLLNRATITTHRTPIILASVLSPLLLLALISATYIIIRHYRYRP